ncbi:MAG: hypothetical protein PF495_16105 [Spirochaetales bacterium]|jgi:hypothetical protein|nr:hypothetical protein [Spirochaetales bacterium]
MRSFNANFITEKNRRADGPSPINLLTFGFSTPVYISDRDVTPSGGSAHQGLVTEWGFIDSSITQTPGRGVLGRIEICDFKIVIINTESPRLSDNFTPDDPPENVTVELYQWFDGLLYSERETLFKGIIHGQPKYDEYTCTLVIRGIWEKYNKKIGEDLIITAADYPNADPDDISKICNVIYGNHVNIPCRCLRAGALDNLATDIDNIATTITLSDSSGFPASGTAQIANEQITYTGNASNQLTGCTRGANATTAVAHTKGAAVAEILAEYIYEIASHPVKSINNIYVNSVRQTANYAAYTGQTGDELAGYEGAATIKFTVLPLLKKQVNMRVDDTIDVDDGITVGDDIAFASAGSTRKVYPSGATGGSTPGNTYDGNDQSKAAVGNSYGYTVTWSFPPTNYGDINTQYAYVKVGIGTWSVPSGWTPAEISPSVAGWFRFSKSGGLWDDQFYVSLSAAASSYVYEMYKEVDFNPALTKSGAASRGGAATKTGIAALAGNSVADTVIGGQVTVDCRGYQDDASGTYTGTPDALIERPDHVFKHLWCEILSAPSGDINSASFNASGSFYSANGYKFSLLINQPILAETLFMRLALQCRSRFFVTPYGKAKLVLRQFEQTSGHSITKNEIKRDSMGIERSPVSDLITFFNIRYDRDHSKESNDPKYYRAVKNFSDGTSISKYGQREWKGQSDIFLFDAVVSDAMAEHVGNFLRQYHSTVRKTPRFDVFLDNMEIEPGDIIDITHPLDQMSAFRCEILKLIHILGSAKNKIIDHIKIIAIEN